MYLKYILTNYPGNYTNQIVIKLQQHEKLRFKLIIQMNISQQLYQEFMNRKNNKLYRTLIHKRRNILNKFILIKDQNTVTLQSSIALMKDLDIIDKIQKVDDIVTIMQNRKTQQAWETDQLSLNQCRLIYFMWAVIHQDQIEVREFKELIMLLIDNQGSDRAEMISQLLGQKEAIPELVDSWDKVMMANCQNEDSQHQISDISIIKTKNQSSAQQNKENFAPNTSAFNITKTTPSITQLLNQKQHNLQKSFQKRDSEPRLDRTITKSRNKSQIHYNTNYSQTEHPLNIFSHSDYMTAASQKQLVQRLYKYDKYKQREELKQKIQEQRIKIQLDQCTFKPQIQLKGKSASKYKPVSTQIKGYQKTVSRLKVGYEKNKELQQNLQYRGWKSGAIVKNRQPSAPKFINRVKQPESILFQMIFQIGRHRISLKIKQTDRINDIVERIGKIYSLKDADKDYIRLTVQQQLNNYYEDNFKDNMECEGDV